MERMIGDCRHNDLKECTLSRMKENKYSKIRKRLGDLSGFSIYGIGSAQHWTQVYEYSYLCMEKAGQEWPKLPTLRASIKKQIHLEYPLITEQEEALLKRVIAFGGSSPLFTDDELLAADSLIRRMWCNCIVLDNGQISLHVSDNLAPRLIVLMTDPTVREERNKLYALNATLRSMVYLHGMLYAEPAITHISHHLFSNCDCLEKRFIYRYLKAEFDYCVDKQGNLVLIHPGLIHPERMLSSISNAKYQAADFSREMVIGGMNELLREEYAAEDILKAELGFVLQPGYSAGSMVNDVKFLIKQGATHEELADLISDKLAVQMTPRLENALKRAEMDTVRWQNTADRRLN